MSVLGNIISLLFLLLALTIVKFFFKAIRQAQALKTNSPGFLFLYQCDKRQAFSTLRKWILQNNQPWFHIWLGKNPTVLTSDPECAQFVLTNREFIEKHPPRTLGVMKTWFKNSVVFTDGEVWKRQRKVFNPAFGRKSYQTYFPIFQTTIAKAFELLENDRLKGGDIDVQPLMFKLTLDLLGKAIFHYNFGLLDGTGNDHYEAYEFITRLARKNAMWRLFGEILEKLPLADSIEYKRSQKVIDDLFHQMLKDRMENPNESYSDMLDYIVEAHKTGGLSEIEVIGNFWILFLAGHDTTASALGWSCYCLARYPELQEKIFQEVKTVVGDGSITFESLNEFKYLHNFIHEVLRVYPPIAMVMSRSTTETLEINGTTLPKGTVVGVSVDALHHHPDHWHEPEKFNPDRFLPENSKGRHKFAYLPFSSGKRECIGTNFSLQEQYLFIATLVLKYKVKPPVDHVQSDDQTIPTLFYTPATNFISLEERK